MTPKRRKFTQWSRRVERNILSVYARANENDKAYGLHWYADAFSECQQMGARHRISVTATAGVVAAISPGLEWGRNLIEANEVVKAFVSGRTIPQVGVYGRGNVNKAVRILKGEKPLDVFPVKTSPKVRAFFSCITNPRCTAVCVDRHAKALAYNLGSDRKGFASNDKMSIVRPAEYPYIAWHYEKLAERLGLIPNQLQAICWVTWKRIEGNLNQEEIPF